MEISTNCSCFTAFNSEIEQSRSAQVGSFTVIGYGTKIGSNSKISDSVIGEGCTIGSNVLIEGSYIWDNVIIEDGCELRHVIVCDGVIMKVGAILKPGVVLSFKVCVLLFILHLNLEYEKLSLHGVALRYSCFGNFKMYDSEQPHSQIQKHLTNILWECLFSFPELYFPFHYVFVSTFIHWESVCLD